MCNYDLKRAIDRCLLKAFVHFFVCVFRIFTFNISEGPVSIAGIACRLENVIIPVCK